MADDVALIRPGMPVIDGCPAILRVPAFVVDQGSMPTLEFVFRMRDSGRPANLSGYFGGTSSESDSASDSDDDATVQVRIKEWGAESNSPSQDPIWGLEGTIEDPASGTMRVQLSRSITERAGIYTMHWAIIQEGVPAAVRQAVLSVERSLFPEFETTLRKEGGSLTLGEIRTSLMDDPTTNLLLDDVEFTDEMILQAVAAPVRRWNETPPPIKRYSTRTFPYRDAWLSCVRGELHEMAANHYRRNYLAAQAAGMAVPDKNKEREYMQEAVRLKDAYMNWLLGKKHEMNQKLVWGNVPSIYSAGRWRS